MKDTLILYRDWWGVIQTLTPEMQLKVFVSICQYAFDGKSPDDPTVSATTAFMRSVIDRDFKKWNEIKQKRSEAGRKGGAPRGNKNAKKQVKTSKTSNCLNYEEKQANLHITDADSASYQANQAIGCFSTDDAAIKKQAKQAKQTFACLPEQITSQEVTTENREVKTSKTSKTSCFNNSIYDINISTDKSVDNNNYNNNTHTLNARARSEDFQPYIDELLADTTFWESSAMANRVPIETLCDLLPKFVYEKIAVDDKNPSFSDFRSNFALWLRYAVPREIKSRNNYETQPQDRYAKRRGADSSADSAEDYTVEI